MKRYERVSPFRVMDLLREAARYPDAIHFEIGQPDLPPPPGVARAMQRAIEEGRYAYTETRGLSKLRSLISRHYARTHSVEVDPDRILLTPGTSVAFMVAYLLSLEPGDRIAMADPSYPCYKNFAYMTDAEPLFLPVDASEGYQILPSMLESERFSAVHISSPANPTGTIYSPENLAGLCELCTRRGARLISDELYQGLTYETQARSVLEFKADAIVINGFSKYFCMPGLRLGWMVLPEELIRPAEIIAQNLYIAAPGISQYGALEAFDYDYLHQVRSEYRRRRDFLLSALEDLFEIPVGPSGAFYLWCDMGRYGEDALEFSRDLLRKTHVAVTPGVDFGSHETRRFLRFAYTRPIEEMREGIERLRRYLR